MSTQTVSTPVVSPASGLLIAAGFLGCALLGALDIFALFQATSAYFALRAYLPNTVGPQMLLTVYGIGTMFLMFVLAKTWLNVFRRARHNYKV